jgi:DNA-binding transcriptional LysR family regulator
VDFVVLVPSNHRLAGHATVELADLAGERFVDLLPGFGNRTTVDRAFDAAGVPRRVQVELPDLTTVPDYVRAGLGVAVVPDLDQEVAAGLARLRLAGPALTWTLSAVTLSGKRPSRAVIALLDLMDDAIRPGGSTF